MLGHHSRQNNSVCSKRCCHDVMPQQPDHCRTAHPLHNSGIAKIQDANMSFRNAMPTSAMLDCLAHVLVMTPMTTLLASMPVINSSHAQADYLPSQDVTLLQHAHCTPLLICMHLCTAWGYKTGLTSKRSCLLTSAPAHLCFSAPVSGSKVKGISTVPPVLLTDTTVANASPQ